MMYWWPGELVIWWVGPRDESAAWWIGDVQIGDVQIIERVISLLSFWGKNILFHNSSLSCHLIKRISQSEKSIHLWCLTLFRKNHISRWSHLRFLESLPHNSRQTKLRIELRAKIAKFRNATIEKDSFDLGQELARDANSFYVVFCPILAPIPNFIQIG